MPAVSKAQQRFMGMVHAIQTNKFHGRASKHLRDAARSMTKQDAKDFAATKHEGLPEHMKEANCTQHDPNTPQSFDKPQPPIELKRLRGLTDAQTKAWAEHAWSLSTEGQSGRKANFVMRQKKAQLVGFVKAAEAAGLSAGQALDLLEKAGGSLQDLLRPNQDIANSFVSLPMANGLAGILGGAGIGGTIGYLGGKNKQHPEKDHSIRDGLLGLIGGAGLGGLAGSTGTVAYLANKHPSVFNQLLNQPVNPHIAR